MCPGSGGVMGYMCARVWTATSTSYKLPQSLCTPIHSSPAHTCCLHWLFTTQPMRTSGQFSCDQLPCKLCAHRMRGAHYSVHTDPRNPPTLRRPIMMHNIQPTQIAYVLGCSIMQTKLTRAPTAWHQSICSNSHMYAA